MTEELTEPETEIVENEEQQQPQQDTEEPIKKETRRKFVNPLYLEPYMEILFDNFKVGIVYKFKIDIDSGRKSHLSGKHPYLVYSAESLEDYESINVHDGTLAKIHFSEKCFALAYNNCKQVDYQNPREGVGHKAIIHFRRTNLKKFEILYIKLVRR
jgi:hypothetical protein